MKRTHGQHLHQIALACAVLLLGAGHAFAAPPPGAVGEGGTLRARCPDSPVSENFKPADAGAAKKNLPCWNAAPGQSEQQKNLPALTRPALQQTQPGLSKQTTQLNPQPLPPQKSVPGDPVKSTIGNSVPQKPALTQFGTNTNNKDPKAAAAQLSKNLFSMEDRAIIIVGGKQTTAGEVKKNIHAEIAKKAGSPKTVKGGARKLDLAALNVKGAANAPPAPPRTMEQQRGPGEKKSSTLSSSAAVPASSSQATGLAARARKESISIAGSSAINSITEGKCLDKGPPVISEVEGRLKPGGKVTVWGRCLGERAGRVEIIGQFPGGKLKPAFTAWDMTGIDLEIPANIHGANDHAVAVTVVTADGKTSPAMQAQFVAARERVEVPERLWSPGAGFELSSTGAATIGSSNPFTINPFANKASAGQTAKTLRVNPQCRLDNMDAIILSGGISQIRGWELGPPNEASVTIDWVGTCIDTTTTTNTNYIIAIDTSRSTTSACRVAFQVLGWAYCPVGIAP